MAIIYKYRLNENSMADQSQIAGINLNKEWKKFDREQRDLIPFIKTRFNESGMLDYEVEDLHTKQKYESSVEESEKPDIFSVHELNFMDRVDLVKVAKYYGIDPRNKVNDFLAKLIYKAQNERVSQKVVR